MARMDSFPTLTDDTWPDLEPKTWPTAASGFGIKLASTNTDNELGIAPWLRFASCVRDDVLAATLPEILIQTRGRTVVVVDEKDYPCGIIEPVSLITTARDHSRSSLADITAADIASQQYASLALDASMADATVAFIESDARVAIVLDDDGKLAGVLTPNDVLAASRQNIRN